MPKKQMKFKDGGKVKHYYTGGMKSYAEDSSDSRGKALPPIDEMESINANVRRALAGERPPAPEYNEMPSPKAKDNKFVKAVEKVQKSQAGDPRMLEAMMSRGLPAVDNSVPSASTSKYQAPSAESMAASERRRSTTTPILRSMQDYYASPSSMEGVKRNVSNTLASLTPLSGGVGKIGAELALGNRAAKAVQAVEPVEKLSAAGRRSKNAQDFVKAGERGRDSAVTNPMSWVGSTKTIDKVAGIESKAVQAEAKAAQAAARKKAAQAKKDAKDPVMNAKPGADKANSGYKYEGDGVFPPMYREGGNIKKFAKGGSVSSASSRADGCAIRGKTKGMISKMKSGGMYGGKGAC